MVGTRLGIGGLAVGLTITLCGPGAAAAQSPQFRGEPAHTGVVETAGLPGFGGVAWRFETDGTVRSSPALDDGTLYVGSSDGHLYALDADDGGLRWSYDAGTALPSSPAVAGGLVIVAGRDGSLHAVRSTTGRNVWTVQAGADRALPWGHEGWDYFIGSPAVVGDTVYWGAGDGVLRALDRSSGDELWRFGTGGRIRGTAAVADGLLVFGSGDGIVYALDAATGAERWRFETRGTGLNSSEFGYDRRQITASAAIADGRVYIGSRDAELYALDAATGRELWTVDEGGPWVIGTAVAAGDRVFGTRSSSGNIRSIQAADGSENWVVSAGAFVFGSPVLVDGTLYTTEGDGDFTAYDADSGEVRWSYRTGAPIYGNPVVHDGRAYFGSDDGWVYALQGADRSVRRAVYWDDELQPFSSWGAQDNHKSAHDFFARRGYGSLDSEGLASFLSYRPALGSVVVMGMDYVTDPQLLRRYLDDGGKVVWMGYPPEYLQRDETGQVTGVERAGPADLLGVDFGVYDGDEYDTRPTEDGRAWGLKWPSIGQGSVRPRDVTTVLTCDELGRAVAWVQNYGGPEGTGFVLLQASTNFSILATYTRVAEYGLRSR